MRQQPMSLGCLCTCVGWTTMAGDDYVAQTPTQIADSAVMLCLSLIGCALNITNILRTSFQGSSRVFFSWLSWLLFLFSWAMWPLSLAGLTGFNGGKRNMHLGMAWSRASLPKAMTQSHQKRCTHPSCDLNPTSLPQSQACNIPRIQSMQPRA